MYLKRNPIAGQGAIYRNPFALSGTSPKIPDGKCYNSSGIRLQSADSFSAAATGNGTMHFMLCPGMTSGLFSKGTTGSAATLTRNLSYSSHLNGALTANGFEQVSDNAVEHWRIVSQAVRFSLVNSLDESDGWFEAIRVPFNNVPNDPALWNWNAATGHLAYTGTGLPSYPTIDDNTLVSQPTYVSGKLADIHKYMFQLRGHSDDHDFVPLLHSGDGVGASASENAVNKLFDSSMDAIYIRIHGRVGAANLAATNVMAHLVSNQELMYRANSTLARFHTQSQFSSKQSIALKKSNTYGSSKAGRMGP